MRPFEQARAHLLAGRSDRHLPRGHRQPRPGRLLRGRRGAARLSLETGAPVVPMGIRFPTVARGQPIPSHAAMELHIGAPLVPPGPAVEQAPLPAVTDWHAAIMTAIARHSGKTWKGAAEEASHDR